MRFLLAFLLFVPFLVQAEDGSSASLGPQWTDEQKAAQRQAAAALLENVKAALKQGAGTFTVPPGDYRFEGATGRNFLLEGVNDFVLDAAGATFWFDPRFGVRLKKCRNVTVRGLTIDTDPLPWIQGTIQSIDPASSALDFALDPGFAAPAADLAGSWRLVFFPPTGTEALHVPDDSASKLEALGNQAFRIAKFGNNRIFQPPFLPRRVQAGDRVALLHPGVSGGNSVLQQCAACALEDVTEYGAGGFAFHESEGEGGNHYLRCKLVLRPGTSRLMASRADCFHSFLTKKGPLIEECEFSHSGDDLLAIHGFFGIVAEAPEGREMTVASTVASSFSVGSTVRFYGVPDGNPLGEAVVESIDPVTDPAKRAAVEGLPAKLRQDRKIMLRPMAGAVLQRVRFDRDVAVQMYDIVSSPDLCGAGAVIRGNSLHDGNVRGILIKSHDLTIENNTIERTAHGGIVLEAELFWLEGPFNQHIRVAGNRLAENGWATFENSGMSSTQAAIHVGDYFGQRMFPRTFVRGRQNEDIEITGNQIERPAAFGIFVANADGVKITDNKITAPFAAGENAPFFDLSRRLTKDWVPSPDKAEILKKTGYAIYLQEVGSASVDGNQVADAPSFLRGEVGYGPDADAP